MIDDMIRNDEEYKYRKPMGTKRRNQFQVSKHFQFVFVFKTEIQNWRCHKNGDSDIANIHIS